jgi:hypothetical protein
MPSEDAYSASPQLVEALTVVLYRMASYTTTHLIDDAAILAIIFC